MHTNSSHGPKWFRYGEATVYGVILGVEIGLTLVWPTIPTDLSENVPAIDQAVFEAPSIVAASTLANGIAGDMITEDANESVYLAVSTASARVYLGDVFRLLG